MASAQVPVWSGRSVLALVTHRDPDIDDVEALRLLKKYGSQKFPGVRDARIITSGERTLFQDMDREGFLCVGVGGSIFDEHPFEGRPRREGESAATLVAKHLGLPSRATVKYAFEKNYSARTDEWEIAPLVKLAFRFGTHSGDEDRDRKASDEIFAAAFLFLNAVEEREKMLEEGREPDGEVTVSMDEIISRWLLKRLGSDRRVSEFIPLAEEKRKSVTNVVAAHLGVTQSAMLEFILLYGSTNRRMEAGDTSDFRLANLVNLAQKQFCVGNQAEKYRDQIRRAAQILLTGVWLSAENFHTNCRKDWESPNTTLVAQFKKNGMPVKIVSVLSDNPEVAKYGRSKYGGRAAVIIKRESSGNTQVFFDQKLGLDPAPVVAALRLAERKAKNITTAIAADVLLQEGNAVEGAEEWFFDKKQILNGSLTTFVPPTALRRQEVEKIVAKAIAKQM